MSKYTLHYGDNHTANLHDMSLNLEGVLSDCDGGEGFDAICLETVRRVAHQLVMVADQLKKKDKQMSDTHTPGPWMVPHLADDECKCNCLGVVEETYAGGIATICLDNGIKILADGGNDCPPLEEAKANARLIAAAPEMLEALENAFDWNFKDDLSNGMSDEYWSPEFQKFHAELKAVIAKAKGQN